jgi:hypothetical protein
MLRCSRTPSRLLMDRRRTPRTIALCAALGFYCWFYGTAHAEDIFLTCRGLDQQRNAGYAWTFRIDLSGHAAMDTQSSEPWSIIEIKNNEISLRRMRRHGQEDVVINRFSLSYWYMFMADAPHENNSQRVVGSCEKTAAPNKVF